MYSKSSDPNKNFKILKSAFRQGKVGIRSGDWNLKRCLVVSVPAKELSGSLTDYITIILELEWALSQ